MNLEEAKVGVRMSEMKDKIKCPECQNALDIYYEDHSIPHNLTKRDIAKLKREYSLSPIGHTRTEKAQRENSDNTRRY